MNDPAPMDTRLVTVAGLLLRNPAALLTHIRRGGPELRELPLPLSLVSLAGLAVFGALLGLGRQPLLAFASAPKLAMVGLGSLAISLPALHVYGRLLGSGNRALQSVCEALVALATMSLTLLALAPVWLVFVSLVGAPPHGYFRVMLGTFGFLGLAGARGVWILYLALRQQQRSRMHLLAWGLLYGLVGVQVAWVLRPFVGMPGEPVVLFRPLEESALDSASKLVRSNLLGPTGEYSDDSY